MSSDIKIWHSVGADIYNGNQCQPAKIQNIIYNIKFDPQRGCLYLSPSNTHFKLPDKIYGLEKSFIDRVVKSFDASQKNLGVLLNGLKGSGKTITSKIICNTLKIPVLTIGEYFDQIPDFINHIDFDCVILVDEYEKVFDHDQRGILLSAMDGIQSPASKVLFILTTNEMYVNQNLLNRPSRIRYVKTYGNLTKEAIIQIVNDELENKEFFDDAINVISQLPLITIDLVLEIIKESNLHGDAPSSFKDFFNCNKDTSKRTYRFIDTATGNVIKESVELSFELNPYFKKGGQLHDKDYEFICWFNKATGANTAEMKFYVDSDSNTDHEDDDDESDESTNESEKFVTYNILYEPVYDKHWMF